MISRTARIALLAATLAAAAPLHAASPKSDPGRKSSRAPNGRPSTGTCGVATSTNAFIAWAGDEVKRRCGVTIRQVKLKDTAEAVTRVVAEKSAGRNANGSVDLIWINGPNFLAMKAEARPGRAA